MRDQTQKRQPLFKSGGKKRRKFGLLLCMMLALTFTVVPSQRSDAGCGCTGCNCGDTALAAGLVYSHHLAGRLSIMNYLAAAFTLHRTWLTNIFFRQQVLPNLQLMTEQLSAVAMHQVFIIGTFFDAEQQLKTQRVFQELQVTAHRDYQPSQDFCWFGTGVRSMAPSEERSKFTALALNARQMGRHLGNAHSSGATSRSQDKDARWEAFVTKYCDPQDNNWVADPSGTGLTLACGTAGGGNTDRINIDIDFTRLIEEPRTLNVSFADEGAATPDEQDVMALGNNLYGNDVLTRNITPEYLRNQQYQHLYLALRSVAAKRAVAENSYNSIVGLKSAGSSDPVSGDAPKTREFLAAIVKELGVTNAAEVYQIIGENPSYYAQLELLAKKIYQNPDFYANLYDKPANVQRKSVALKAIELMLDRAIFESQLRQEMAMSVLLSAKLKPLFNEVNEDLSTARME